MSLINPTSLEEKIKTLEKEIYKPHRLSNCSIHHRQINSTCLNSKCTHYCMAACPDCHPSNCTSQLIEINRIVPKLVQWALQQWSSIKKEHKQIESQWKICLVNINYCMDILRQLQKQIEQRSQSIQLTLFPDLLAEVYGMLSHDSNNQSTEMMLRNFARLNSKYHLLSGNDKGVGCSDCEQERKHKRNQVKKASHSSKQFSEKALIFSQDLARIIEQKLKLQKRVNRLKQLSSNRIFNLRDLMKQEAKLDEVQQLMIEVPKGDAKQTQPIQKLIQKCENLHSLRINNKNGAIQKQRWRMITSGMEYLKQLRQLSLHLRAADLPILIALFKQRSKAIRQVEKLTLQITDEKDLNIGEVCDFINTMQLRSLNLTLSRDNLKKNQGIELLQKLRLASSMSQLPLGQFHLNLNKNKIQNGQQISQLANLFSQKASNIKIKSIVI